MVRKLVPVALIAIPGVGGVIYRIVTGDPASFLVMVGAVVMGFFMWIILSKNPDPLERAVQKWSRDKRDG